MEMINLRWCKSEWSFPQQAGDGKVWWLVYADVRQQIDVKLFNKGFRALFLHMNRLNWIMRGTIGVMPEPYEYRNQDGKYEPW